MATVTKAEFDEKSIELFAGTEQRLQGMQTAVDQYAKNTDEKLVVHEAEMGEQYEEPAQFQTFGKISCSL